MVTTIKRLQDAAVATGVGNQFVANAYTYVICQVFGTFVGTVTWQASLNGNDWVAIRAVNMNTGNAATTTTGTGLFQIGVAGLGLLRANITAYTSGTVHVWARGGVY